MSRSSALRPGLVAILAMTLAGCAGASPGPSASPTSTTPPTPSASPSPAPTQSPTAQPTPASLPPDGTWQVKLTAAELEAAGWTADVTPPGTYTWTFDDGRATIELNPDDGSVEQCEADMHLLDGSNFRLDYDDAGACGGEVDQLSWTLDDDGLHLMVVSSNAPLDQQKAYNETKPWQLVDER